MTRDVAAGDPANANESLASFMSVQAYVRDDRSNDLLEQEIKEYVSEAYAAARLYLIV